MNIKNCCIIELEAGATAASIEEELRLAKKARDFLHELGVFLRSIGTAPSKCPPANELLSAMSADFGGFSGINLSPAAQLAK
jgi:hypothetical protein